MPKVVESFPKSSKRLIPYEWDKWFDGQIWAFVEGVDYFNEKTFRSALAQASKKRKIKVSTLYSKEEKCLYLQAVGISTAHP